MSPSGQESKTSRGSALLRFGLAAVGGWLAVKASGTQNPLGAVFFGVTAVLVAWMGLWTLLGRSTKPETKRGLISLALGIGAFGLFCLYTSVYVLHTEGLFWSIFFAALGVLLLLGGISALVRTIRDS